ncbi:unnamed protein product [Eruca vesicaria subsp. sativa]|uniref:Uncharacterized protein n=1 Tax=Eruca vesicaria subsp. sativa TaxID=29727 RepID=A0ABC8J5W5_ERUVS|nr:unnamed protein product [Eruca vesicaria subsp. sativa]
MEFLENCVRRVLTANLWNELPFGTFHLDSSPSRRQYGIRFQYTLSKLKHFEPRHVSPPIIKKCDWETEHADLDFFKAAMIGKGSFGEIVKLIGAKHY